MTKPSKSFLQALHGHAQKTPPFWFMRQAGRYLPEYRELRKNARNFLNFCYTPDLAVEATLQPLRRFNPDAAILFCDILVIPDAMGQKVEFREGEGPVLERLRGNDDLVQLKTENVCDHLAPVFKTVRRLAAEIPETTALIGFAGAPWTVATYMVEGRGGTDFSRALAWDAEDRAGFAVLMDKLVEATAAYLTKQAANGAEALQLFDTWAGVLNEDQFRRLVVGPTKAIIEKVRAEYPEIPFIGFPRGADALYGAYVTQTGVNGVGIDRDVNLAFAATELQKHCTVQGNLDPLLVVEGGDKMRAAAAEILDTLGKGPFVFNLGHGVVPQTPVENVIELAAQISAWRNG
ncbi:MAG: uroporphyrinogen decarboxylase [Alphaproteobacteria bacterium]|nr:uroporphyrinogen decarboxylase [Alphaproteobacteria bacterium]